MSFYQNIIQTARNLDTIQALGYVTLPRGELTDAECIEILADLRNRDIMREYREHNFHLYNFYFNEDTFSCTVDFEGPRIADVAYFYEDRIYGLKKDITRKNKIIKRLMRKK